MTRTLLSLFLTGVVLGYGPCLLSCGPLLVSYISATKDSSWSGLRTYAIFSLVRLIVYLVFGLLVGFLGEWVLYRFFESGILKVGFFLFGLFLFIVGLLLMLEKFPLAKMCQPLIHRFLAGKDTKNIIVFGLIVSFSPCLPLMSILGYIALISDTWYKGLVYMAAFGLGTILSPMIMMSMFSGWVGRVFKKNDIALRALKVICGIVLIYLGFNLAWVSAAELLMRPS